MRLNLSKGGIVKDLVWATGLTLAGFCSALCPASVAAQGVESTQSNVPANTPADDYGALASISAKLSPRDKSRAQAIFSTAFSLWKTGDFAAAEIGFKNGLDIDPANVPANFYYGDCLARRKDKSEAKDYLMRAATFGGMSAEGLKAQAALAALSKAPSTIGEMTVEEVESSYLGDWHFVVDDHEGTMNITKKNGSYSVSGSFPTWLSGKFLLNSISVNGGDVSIATKGSSFIPSMALKGKLVSAIRIEGKFDDRLEWIATKIQPVAAPTSHTTP